MGGCEGSGGESEGEGEGSGGESEGEGEGEGGGSFFLFNGLRTTSSPTFGAIMLALATFLPVGPVSFRTKSVTSMATAGPDPDLTSARRVIPYGRVIFVSLAMPKKPTIIDPGVSTTAEGALIRYEALFRRPLDAATGSTSTPE